MSESSKIVLLWPDYVIVCLYLLALIGIGIYYRKFASKDLEHYFLAGRNMKGWMTGTSYAATCMNTDVAPAYCGMTVVTGVWICWWYVGRFGLALMIGAILFAVFWRRLKIFTSPEFYELRFSGGPALTMRSWVSLRSAFIAVVAWTGSGLLGLAKVTEGVMGWSKWQTFLIAIPVILLYVELSGYVGVVVSDILQSAIIILSSLVLMMMVLIDFGGPTGLYYSLVDQFGTSVTNWHPPVSHEVLGLIGIIAWGVGKAIGYGGDIAPMDGAMEGQRLLSCKTNREASKMYIWTETVLFFMLAVLTLPALGAMVKWPGLNDGSINRELAYGMLLAHYLPTGFLGLALIALCASVMSTIDSNMNFGAQVFINDIYRRTVNPNASMKHYMIVGKVIMFIIMGMGLLVATNAKNVIDVSVFMLGLSAAELSANWGQWWWWRFNGKARLTASFGGPLIFLINKFIVFKYWILLEDPTYIIVLSSIALTFVSWVLVALLTKPEPKEKLIEFYKMARPLGWWGPIEQEVSGQKNLGNGNLILKGFGISIIGMIMISSGVISLSLFYIANWKIATLFLIICAVLGIVFKRIYGRYMNLLDSNK